LYVQFVIGPTVTRDKSKTKQIKTRQDKTKQKQITIPSYVCSILYYIISHNWMHLGKYSVLKSSLDNRCGIILCTCPWGGRHCM